MERITGRKIARQAEDMEIAPSEAEALFRQLHQEPAEIMAVVPRKDGGFNAVAIKARYVFDYTRSQEHYEDRKDIEEGFKHGVGMVFYGATGVMDGAVEGVVYLSTEIVESFSFGAARLINRVQEGWKRGWKD